MSLKNRKAIFVFQILIFLGIWFIVNEVKGQANNSISGFVFGLERRPISDASVELSDEYYSPISRVKTDGSGRYSFSRLRRGRYFVRVSPIGTNFEPQTKEVEIASISRGASTDGGSETVQQNFTLTLQKGVSASLAVTAVVFAQDIPKEAQKSYEKGVSLLKIKKTDEGFAEIKKALEIFPNYYLALEKLGQEYILLSQYETAKELLSKAVEINPRGYESIYGLGYSFFQLKKYPEALEMAKKASEINSSSVNSLFLFGICLKQAGRYAEAVESLQKANKLANSSQPEIHWQLSLIYTNNLKKYAEAANELELFLKANPNYEESAKVKDLIKKLKAKASN